MSPIYSIFNCFTFSFVIILNSNFYFLFLSFPFNFSQLNWFQSRIYIITFLNYYSSIHFAVLLSMWLSFLPPIHFNSALRMVRWNYSSYFILAVCNLSLKLYFQRIWTSPLIFVFLLIWVLGKWEVIIICILFTFDSISIYLTVHSSE